jgi:hypothetical protein
LLWLQATLAISTGSYSSKVAAPHEIHCAKRLEKLYRLGIIMLEFFLSVLNMQILCNLKFFKKIVLSSPYSKEMAKIGISSLFYWDGTE